MRHTFLWSHKRGYHVTIFGSPEPPSGSQSSLNVRRYLMQHLNVLCNVSGCFGLSMLAHK